MNENKSLFSNLRWIFEVSERFARVDRKGRSAVTSILATLGICFGVMTLVVVMSVMNGFQMSFIDSIVEISSYHIRVSDIEESSQEAFNAFCRDNKKIKCAVEFYDAQTLMTGARGREQSAVIRAIDPDAAIKDEGFMDEAFIVDGRFDLSQEDSIILGSVLARKLDVFPGDTVNLFVLSGGSDVNLFSEDRIFKVTGIFKSGYGEINSGYAFINIRDGEKYFGESAKKITGLKIKNYSNEVGTVAAINNAFPSVKVSSWREYNKAFFGALRIEKNMLLLLVAMIFVVVGINIYNGMRRLVFERKSEIAILSALGGKNSEIMSIFIMRGFVTGVIGAFSGLVLGLLISVNTEFVFNAASKILYYFQYAFTALVSPENVNFVQENSSYNVYANIPARVFFPEIFFITIFGILSPLSASWAASRNVLKMTVAEVLHYE